MSMNLDLCLWAPSKLWKDLIKSSNSLHPYRVQKVYIDNNILTMWNWTTYEI